MRLPKGIFLPTAASLFHIFALCRGPKALKMYRNFKQNRSSTDFHPQQILNFNMRGPVTRLRNAVASSPTHHGLVSKPGVKRGTTKLVCARTHSKRESKSCNSSESRNTPSPEYLKKRSLKGNISQI